MQTQNKFAAGAAKPGFAAYLYASPETALLIQELSLWTNTAVRFPGPGQKNARFAVFCRSESDARRVAEKLRALMRAAPDVRGRVRCVQLPDTDWEENWKRHFHVRRISPRLVVKPVFRDYRCRPDESVIEIDPGLSFGTGLHPTTRACLRLIDGFMGDEPRGSFLDIGCGTGILAIAAALLTRDHAARDTILALDNDPQAVRAARQNILLNGLTRRVECRQADITRRYRSRRFNLVAANLLSGLLIKSAANISATLTPSGRLIVSGILRRQYPAVRRAFEAQGLHEVKTIIEGEWKTGGFKN